MSASELLPGMTPDQAFAAGRERGQIDAWFLPIADLPRGASLRDLFAAFSLAGQRASGEGGGTSSDAAARTAYYDADRMLAERATAAASPAPWRCGRCDQNEILAQGGSIGEQLPGHSRRCALWKDGVR